MKTSFFTVASLCAISAAGLQIGDMQDLKQLQLLAETGAIADSLSLGDSVVSSDSDTAIESDTSQGLRRVETRYGDSPRFRDGAEVERGNADTGITDSPMSPSRGSPPPTDTIPNTATD